MDVLLLGGGGFLGKKLKTVLLNDAHNITAPPYSELDIRDACRLNKVFEESRPEVVLLAAAMTNVDGCEKDKEKAYEVNVFGTRNVVNACSRHDAKLVFFSTDFVFDGVGGSYEEDNPPNPLSYYAKTKRWGEEEIIRSSCDYIIERVSVLYGYNDASDKLSFVKWVIGSLNAHMPIHVVTDQYSCPALIDEIASATLSLLLKKEKGIFHVAGSECLSRFDFALTVADVFHLDNTLIAPTTSETLSQIAIRPRNSCLSIEKIKKRGIRMSDTKTGLAFMKGCMK